MRGRIFLLGLIALAVLTLATACPSSGPAPGLTNQPPTASFSCSQTSGQSPLAVTFDASASTDPDGSISQYDWEFGDGTVGIGVTASHTYIATTYHTYVAKLTVLDNGGENSSTTRSISVSTALAPTGNYVASSQSDVFHRLSCRYVDQIKPENNIYFSTRDEAIASGRRPCKVCNP